MPQKIRIAIFVCVVFLFAHPAYPSTVQWECISGQHMRVTCVALHPVKPQVMYMGSRNCLYVSEDAGASWRPVLSLRNPGGYFSAVVFHPQDARAIFACSQAGLFRSFSEGKKWERIFSGRDSLQSQCLCIAFSRERIYLGTAGGLFISRDEGRTWQKSDFGSGNQRIYSLACSPDGQGVVYAAASSGVFKSEDSGLRWQRTFFASTGSRQGQNGIEDNVETDTEEPEETGVIPRSICMDCRHPRTLYLATSGGIYYSNDNGEQWRYFDDYGLLNKDVRGVYCGAGLGLGALTANNAFVYAKKRWQELTLRLYATGLKALVSSNDGTIYIASEKGLFKGSVEPAAESAGPYDLMAVYTGNEPSIGAVHEAAIHYAEVSPQKIKEWRKRASQKAWLPEVSVGIDRDTSDLWHWEGGSTTKADDDYLVRGRDAIAWDVTLRWDLGEIIWNDDQTSIDVRSRLMVELRQDILDEVTKIYFERLRTKMEIDRLSIEEKAKRFDKELKVRELTASLDALTGGYFSEQIRKSGNSQR